jgi:hypothetical protein
LPYAEGDVPAEGEVPAEGDVPALAVADGEVAVADGEVAVADGEEDDDPEDDGEDDGDVLADGEDDGDGLAEAEAEAEADGEDDDREDDDGLGAADCDVAGVAVGEPPGDGVTEELKKLDEAGNRSALGVTEGEGAAGDGGCTPGVVGTADSGAGAAVGTPAPACGWAWLAGGVRSAPIMAKAATPEPTTSTPLTNAEASGREMRCRPGRPGRPGGG